MTNLKIIFKKRGSEETKVTVPLQSIHFSIKYVPKELRAQLDSLGIDIGKSAELAREKALTGNLIEIETSTFSLILSVE